MLKFILKTEFITAFATLHFGLKEVREKFGRLLLSQHYTCCSLLYRFFFPRRFRLKWHKHEEAMVLNASVELDAN